MSSKKTDSFSAKDSLGAYLYQVESALRLLLESPDGTKVSIENLDDIELQRDTKVELVQVKLHTKSIATLGDSSPDIWKTIRVWSEQIKGKKVDLSESTLVLMTNGAASEGSAASLLRQENRDELRALRLLLAAADKSQNTAIAPCFAAFKALKDNDRRALLERMTVLDSSLDHEATRRRIFVLLRDHVPTRHTDQFSERVLGWWYRKIFDIIRTKDACYIDRSHLSQCILDSSYLYRSENLPDDFAQWNPDEADQLSALDRLFVKQLMAIAINNTNIRNCITDYYRAYNQRSKWIKDGLIFNDEIEKYEARLHEEWKREIDLISEDFGGSITKESGVIIGRKMWTWLSREADFPIRERYLYPYLTRGSYHILADAMKVWWNPEFIHAIQKAIPENSYD